MSQLTKWISLLLIAMLLNACSLLKFNDKKEITIASIPSSAEVVNAAGEVVGVSPISLQAETLAKLTDGDKLIFSVRKPGFETQTLVVDLSVTNISSHVVKLKEQSASTFSNDILLQYSKQTNEMIREILSIQGLIVASEWALADERLNGFEKKFSNIAAALVLRANVEINRGQVPRALEYLKRARSIDPDDTYISRLILSLQGRVPAGEAKNEN